MPLILAQDGVQLNCTPEMSFTFSQPYFETGPVTAVQRKSFPSEPAPRFAYKTRYEFG